MLRTRKLRLRREAATALSKSPYGLLSPLNGQHRTKRARDLINLLLTLQEIERIEVRFAGIERQLREDPNYLPGGIERAPRELYVQANDILSACQWSPRVSPPPNESHSFTWNARTHESDWENKFVLWILNLRARGDLSLVRSCRNCGTWFYAVTNHQTNCTDRCRQQFHSKDNTFREKRRLYMRRYREIEKARSLVAKLPIKKGTQKAAPARQLRKKGGH